MTCISLAYKVKIGRLYERYMILTLKGSIGVNVIMEKAGPSFTCTNPGPIYKNHTYIKYGIGNLVMYISDC